MQRFLSLLIALLLCLPLLAQSPKEELKKNLRLSAGNFMAYPTPPHYRLTPAPKGKQPFYISHYGRHGSRYHTKGLDYSYAYDALLQADHADALSPLGKDVLRRLTIIQAEATDYLGDLTPLGAEQMSAIAQRMVANFPEVFTADAVVDAHSTTIPRCILSMSCFLVELQKHAPQLTIRQQASEHEHFFMRHAFKAVAEQEAKDAYQAFCDRHQCHRRLVASLFADTAYVSRRINAERLNYYLFRVASSLQNSHLCQSVSLYDLFHDDEIYENWLRENASWFLGYGFSSLTANERPYSQTALLANIIGQADSCLLLPHPSSTLRFGHETVLLPLVCLLDVNGFGQHIDDLDQLERRQWVSYRVLPMASNIQFVFYRSEPGDNDVLVKVLLNEQEATLPLKTDIAPYYHWNDVRRHYQELLDDYAHRHR